jgi:hypothetical protein
VSEVRFATAAGALLAVGVINVPTPMRPLASWRTVEGTNVHPANPSATTLTTVVNHSEPSRRWMNHPTASSAPAANYGRDAQQAQENQGVVR